MHNTQEKCLHHGKDILYGYLELCTKKKERILQPRNQNAFASPRGASFHVIEHTS